jgi:hypothetical protein
MKTQYECETKLLEITETLRKHYCGEKVLNPEGVTYLNHWTIALLWYLG